MTLVILFSLKTTVLLENGLQLHSGVTALFSMRTELLASLQTLVDVQILLISCSFREILAKSYFGTPWELTPPPRGNPGSATGKVVTALTLMLDVNGP